jgi:predicted ester cyclase
VALEAKQRDMIERMLREIDAGNADVYLDQSLFSPDFVTHLPGTAEPIRGAQAMRDLAAAHLKSLPNIKHEVLNFFPGPEVVVVRHNTTFDHTVDYFGAAPTGNSISETAIWVLRIQNGVFVEMWAEHDTYGSGVQMGMCTPFSEG